MIKMHTFRVKHKKKILIISSVLLIYLIISTILTLSQLPVIRPYSELANSSFSLVQIDYDKDYKIIFNYYNDENDETFNNKVRGKTKNVLTNFYLTHIFSFSGDSSGEKWIVQFNKENNKTYFYTINDIDDRCFIHLYEKDNNKIDLNYVYIKKSITNENVKNIYKLFDEYKSKFKTIDNLTYDFFTINQLPPITSGLTYN